jgi:hypothetical protein
MITTIQISFLAIKKNKIALPFHQIEGITTQNGLQYYLTNENFTRNHL